MTADGRLTRRTLLTGAAAATGLALAPASARVARAAAEFRIGMFYAIAGPAAGLFGPTQKACAELAVEEINARGGLLGRRVTLHFANGDGPVAEATKSAVRLMLEEKVDFFLGSHNSAVREALVGTIKARVPYVYTPIYEGGECGANTYVLADTPQQQMETALPWIARKTGYRTVFFIGNDYVWPQITNRHARRIIEAGGGKVIGEEYVPLGAPNKFEEGVTRIKAARPDFVLITLVGADNVNFNRTFAGFGLDREITRLSSLLEENTLAGIGAESSTGLYGCMSYYASIDSPENRAFKAAYRARYGDRAPVLSLIGADCYAGIKFIEAVVTKARGTDAARVATAASGLTFDTPTGRMTMHRRHVDKNMFLAECRGVEFHVVETFRNVKSGQTCA
jgi:ABC-type branched-subunit amino acid transport system substrate-binding protein